MKIWHRFCLGIFSLAVAFSITWALLACAPSPTPVRPAGLPLQLFVLNLAYNPLLAN